MNIKLYFAENVTNPFTGQILISQGTVVTEDLILTLNQYGVNRYTLTLWKPAELGESLDGWESLENNEQTPHRLKSTDGWEAVENDDF